MDGVSESETYYINMSLIFEGVYSLSLKKTDENGREMLIFDFGCYEAILSSSDPLDLNKALVEESDGWYVPGRRGRAKWRDFRKQTGWNGECFIRLVDDVFLFRGTDKEEGRWFWMWRIARISVP